MPNWSIRLFFLFVVLLYGQTIAAQRPHMKHYGVGDGLASSTVYGAYQDRHGYMWFATESGVNRFDGTEFETFTTADGLPSNAAFSFAEDNTGRLWVSCNNSRPAYFDGRRWVVDDKLIPLSSEQGVVRNLSFSKVRQTLFFNFGKPTYSLNEDIIKEIQLKIPKGIYDTPVIVNIQSINDDYIILHSGISSYILENDKTRLIHLFSENKRATIAKSVNEVLIRAEQQQLGVYIVSSDGIISKNEIQFESKVADLLVDNKGKVYVTLNNKEILQYKIVNQDLIFESQIHSEISKLGAVYVDREQNVWFTSVGGGLFCETTHGVKSWQVFENKQSTSFHSLYLIDEQRLMAGDAFGNIHVFKSNNIIESKKITRHKAGRILKCAVEPKTSTFWFASDQGLTVTDSKFKILREINLPAKSFIFSRDSAIVSFFSQVARVPIYQNTTDYFQIKEERAYSLFNSHTNQLWIGGFKSLQILSNKGTTDLGAHFPIVNARISGIIEDKIGQIWVATQGNGIAIFDNNQKMLGSITQVNGLASNQCQNISYDQLKYIWVSTNAGLSRINIESYAIENYSSTNVLLDNDVLDCQIKADTVWVASSTGITRFVDKIDKTSNEFRTVISKVWVNDSLVSGNLSLTKHQNDLQLRLSALSFKSAGLFEYEYKIENQFPPIYNFTWETINQLYQRYLSNNEAITEGNLPSNDFKLSNLAPGCYKLTFRGISFDKVKSNFPAELLVEIKPGIESNLWFQIFVLSITYYLLLSLYRWKKQVERNELQLKEQLGSLQFEAFKTRINPHFVFNSINGVQQFFFPPEPEKANAYISLLSTLLRKTMYMSDVNFVTLKDELLYISDFLAMAKLRLGRAMEYRIDLAENLDDRIEIPAMILQPLLENAIIHGAKDGLTQVRLNISVTDQVLSCIVEDHGHGIFKKKKQFPTITQHESKGLALIRQRIDALNSVFKTRIELEILDKSSISNQTLTGTKVTLKIDLKHARKEK